MTPNEAATVPTEPATLHTVRSTAAPAHRPTAALNSTATNVSAETSIQTANSTSTWNAPPTPRNRFAKRSGPDLTIEVGIKRRHYGTRYVGPATGATADEHKRFLVSLMSSNDEVERREVAPTTNEADLSRSSTSLHGPPKTQPLAIARTDC